MRKVDEKAYSAFINRRNFNGGNTTVTIDNNGDASMYLFGNKIAKTEGSDILISSGGYKPTVTTRSRLSMFVNISKHNGRFIINNVKEWNGEWTNINEFN